jgi:large subunit ribosomal protein L30
LGYIRVKWAKSYIGRSKDQRETIKSLGFKKLNEERVLKNTPEIRGMIKKVIHLVEILEDVR